MGNQGWIKLHRKIQNHWLYQEKRKFSKFEAWIDLLMMVNHEDAKVVLGNEIIEVKRGQRITSIRQLCEKWGWSNTKVTQFLKLLQNDGMVAVKSDSKKTLITINNYEFYQGEDDRKTTENRQENDEKQTKKHTNKNDKNDKNDNVVVSKADGSKNPVQFYEKNFGALSPFQIEILWSWVDDFGDTEIINYAISEVAKVNPRSPFKYLEGILKNWYRMKLFTVNDVLKDKERRKVKPIRKSLFDQGEESRRRQARAEKEAELIDDEELRRLVEEMPY